MTRTKRLLRENNAFEKQLNPEFNAVLTDMVVYLRSAPVSEYNQELVRRDLGQMFLEAQLRGDGPETVIGGDYRQFCDQVLDQVPRLTARERALDGLSTALLCLAVWGVIWLTNRGLVTWLRPGAVGWSPWPTLAVTVGDLLATAIILAAAWYLFRSVSRTAFSDSAGGLLIKTFLVLAALLLVNRVFDAVLLEVHFAAALAGVVLCFLLHRALEHFADR